MLGALRALSLSRRTIALIALIGWLGAPFLHDLVHAHEAHEEAEAREHGGGVRHVAHHEHADDHDDPAEHGRDSAEHGDLATVPTAPPILPPAPLEYTFTAPPAVTVPWCSEGAPRRLVARPPPSSVA